MSDYAHPRTGTWSEQHTSPYTYKLYVPGGYRPEQPVPLIMMLHGCTQTPDDFAAATEMNWYAERYTFIVAYPDQPRKANSHKCWNWFRESHQQRGKGEPGACIEILEHIRQTYAVDQERIYAAGMSAGAAMAVILGTVYPDVFAAIGVCAGVEYRAATSAVSALATMRRGSKRTRSWDRVAYTAMGPYRRVVPLILFHGTADKTIAPINAQRLLAQWAFTSRLATDGTMPLLMRPDRASRSAAALPGGYTYTEQLFEGADGETIIHAYLIEEMGHAWPGGSPMGSFTDPLGPPASRLIVEFFLAHPLGDTPRPGRVQPPVRPSVAAAEEPVSQIQVSGFWQHIRQRAGNVLSGLRTFWRRRQK